MYGHPVFILNDLQSIGSGGKGVRFLELEATTAGSGEEEVALGRYVAGGKAETKAVAEGPITMGMRRRASSY